jgi:hypothetical protein
MISELEACRARLKKMDEENGAFTKLPAPPQGQAAAPAQGQGPAAGQAQPQASKDSDDFVRELAIRFDNVERRVDHAQREVGRLVNGGFVVSGFPSGQSKAPNP